MEENTSNRIRFGKGEVDPEKVFTVSELNRQARALLESKFSHIWVEGEISNLSVSSSNHAYFTLKEEGSEISAVMFSGDRTNLDLALEDGIAVLAKGTLTVYERRGRYQLLVRDLKEIGAGKLQKQFEKLKKQLKEEGLFDVKHKKPIPRFPFNIGVITSSTGAAVRDIVTTIEERFPPVSVYVFPVTIQGEKASGQIADAIRQANRPMDRLELDVLIVGRGGGSLEDLWPFNEEVVARAIFESEIPIVSAVGHEVDFTISDFVADKRVPTPTAAGKVVVPDKEEILNLVDGYLQRMKSLELSLMNHYREYSEQITSSFAFRLPFRALEDKWQEYDRLSKDLSGGMSQVLSAKEEDTSSLVKRLSLANPTRLLGKGYSITTTEEGEVLTEAVNAEVDESLKTQLFKGIIRSVVTEVKEDGGG